MEIKVIKNDFSDMSVIEQAAYAGSFKGTKDELEQLNKIFLELTEQEDIEALGAYDGDLMGCVLHYNFDTNFHGQMIKTAGIGSLAVDLLHKKKGVANALIQASLDKAKDSGKELYYLYPFNTKFYRNFGFGYGSPMYTYCIAPKDFMDKGDRSILSYGSEKDHEDVFKCHDDYARKHNGMSFKTYGDKRRIKTRHGVKLLLAKDEGKIIGYLLYTQRGIDDHNKQAQMLDVAEMLYTPKALLAFASFFHAQKDQIDYVQLATHDPYFHHVLCNTCYVPEPKTQEIISLKASDKSIGLMPLVLQPQKLLDRLVVDLDCELVFIISYPRKNHEVVTIGQGKRVDIKLTINEFSSWITGAIGLKDLYRLGQLETDSPELLKNIDIKFSFDRPQSLVRY